MSIYKTKMVNGVEVKLTANEIKELEARDKAWADGEYDRLMASIREERTNLLAECDWMGMSDVTMSDAWKTYRQKLRDITKDVDTVEKAKAVTMPEKPK
tara:strand:- start:1234 stop:1530 length:297 start_codon:yes stop_codon:yes gene_type:complete